jgi:hypothetical protein
MSSGGKNRQDTWPQNVYACCYPAGKLANSKRACQFFDKLAANEECRWELLCPDPYPENLVALYLLDIARQQMNSAQIGKEVSEGIMPAATKEYAERVPGSKLPSDPAERIGTLQKMFASLANR